MGFGELKALLESDSKYISLDSIHSVVEARNMGSLLIKCKSVSLKAFTR